MNRLIDLALRSNMEVVISTWKSCSAEIVLLQKKYPKITYCLCSNISSSPGYSTFNAKKEINFDRQWFLINASKHLCGKNYIVRVRSDIYVNLETLIPFKSKIDAGLILTTDVSSINPALIFSSKLVLHPCDWLLAASSAIFFSLIDDSAFYFDLLQSHNYALSQPYAVEDRTYVSFAAAEQLFGSSILRMKSDRNFFTETVIPFSLVSSVGAGFFVVEAKTLELRSEKQRLRFLYPFRLRESDNYSFNKFRFRPIFLLEIFIFIIRILSRRN